MDEETKKTNPEETEKDTAVLKFEKTDANAKSKKTRVRFKDMTPEQKKKKHKRDWIITGSVFGFVILLFAVFALTGYLGAVANTKMVRELSEIEGGSALTPSVDPETGCWTFTTDGDFKVLQLTDIHIGAGAFSIKNDDWALNAVYTLIKNEKPDLVIVTGDIAYPVPFQAGTFDNKREAELFATLMEQTGVYWAICFGNHDTEAYSMYTREEISDFYQQDRWEHCLYQEGPSGVDDYGCGNYIINVKNSLGMITQSLVMLDSHSYTQGDIFGTGWKYDNIHQVQVDWYSNRITAMNEMNRTRFAALDSASQTAYAASLGMTGAEFSSSSMIKSCMFFHIPLTEYKDAWEEYVANGYADTADVQYKLGVAGETGKVIYCGIGTDELFETAEDLGSTQGIFCGHDHLNNFSVEYKGIRLTYGMSIDYLAYAGIWKKTEQRGGTLITLSQNGSMSIAQRRLSDY